MTRSTRRPHGSVWLLLVVPALFLGGLTWGNAAPGEGLAGCVDVMQNGGFEAGSTGWQQQSALGYSLISDANARTGGLGAYLAGVNNADDRLSQQVTLPAGASVTLRLWWYMSTTETAGVWDHLVVALLRPDGSLMTTIASIDNTASAHLWQELAVDLSPYAGQTVVLRFTATTDQANTTDFYVDDVSLVACTADPTATRTPTKASTVTQTPTRTPTLTASATLTATRTPTPTSSATHTAAYTATQTPSRPPDTATRTATLAASATGTATHTVTAAPASPTLTRTATWAAPFQSATPSATPPAGATPSKTASPTTTPESIWLSIYLPSVIR